MFKRRLSVCFMGSIDVQESWMFWEGLDSKVKLSLYRTLLNTRIQNVSGLGK